MLDIVRGPSFLPACILSGVGILFLVLAFALPFEQTLALVAGSAVAVGLVLARLRREMVAGQEPVTRTRARG